MKKRWYDNPEEDPFYVALGQAVVKRRKALGLTQQQVAEIGGLSRSEVQFIENAKRRETLQTIRRCCYALNDIWLAELFLEVERHTYREGLNGPILVA